MHQRPTEWQVWLALLPVFDTYLWILQKAAPSRHAGLVQTLDVECGRLFELLLSDGTIFDLFRKNQYPSPELVCRFVKIGTLRRQVEIAPPVDHGSRVHLCDAARDSLLEFVLRGNPDVT